MSSLSGERVVRLVSPFLTSSFLRSLPVSPLPPPLPPPAAHTVTQSSALEICNKTLDPAAFTASGMQQQGFKMKVDITDDTKPIWYYCSVPTHCQKGMFGACLSHPVLSVRGASRESTDRVRFPGVINMPLTQDPNKMLGGKMEAWGKQHVLSSFLPLRRVEKAELFPLSPGSLAGPSRTRTSSTLRFRSLSTPTRALKTGATRLTYVDVSPIFLRLPSY